MKIQSAANSGLQGLNRADKQLREAANNIATEQVTPLAIPSETETPQVSVPERPALTESLVQLKVAENHAKASTNVIKTADEVLGTLIDVRA